MKYLQNFVLLTIIYQTQCQSQTMHNYIAESKVEGPLFVPPVDNPIFTLENSQDNFKAVFQAERSTVSPIEFSPPHPPSYQMAFGPPAFLNQRPEFGELTLARKTQTDSTTSAKLIETGVVATPTEEKYERLLASFGPKIWANHKQASKRDSPSGFNTEVPEIPVLNFAVLPSLDNKNTFSSLSPLTNDGFAERSFNLMNSESPLQFDNLPSIQAVQAPTSDSDLAPTSGDFVPPQLSSLLPSEISHSVAWNTHPTV